jgi:PEGA domain.
MKQDAYMKTIAKILVIACVEVLFCLSSMAQTPQKPVVMPADSAKLAQKKDTLASDTAKAGFGKLHVVSQPDSAQVVVDSILEGIAPLIIDSISAGPHIILVKKKGYFVKKINIVIRARATEELTVSLVKPGSVYVKSEPAGAHCFIDTKEAGITPCEIAKLKPGDYDLGLELVNRTTQNRHISVKESICDTLSINLPFAQAYLDSVAAKEKTERDEKVRKKRIRNYMVAGIFGVFAAAILIMEATDR